MAIRTSWRAGINAPAYELKVKDPVATCGRSDDWDFPTNKFPNVGWLGRVHRGTPWQTRLPQVAQHRPPHLAEVDRQWPACDEFGPDLDRTSGALRPRTYYRGIPSRSARTYDAFFTTPTNDWRMLDLFTAALNDNATRGQLSINQTNLAAWSAVLSGVVVLTNAVDRRDGNPSSMPMVIRCRLR